MDRLKTAFAGFAPRDYVFLGGYALYLAFGYIVFESSTMFSSADSLGVHLESLFLIAVLVMRSAIYATTAILSRRGPRISLNVTVAASACVGLAGSAIIGMLFQFSGLLPSGDIMPWLVVGGALFGAGGALINLLWGRFCAALGLRTAYLFVLLSNLTSLAVYFAVTLMPSFTYVPACAVLFIVSMAAVRMCIMEHPIQGEEYSREMLKGVWSLLWRPILGTAVLSFMSGFMLQVSAWHPLPLDMFQSVSLLTQAVVVGALLVPALFVKHPPMLGSVYKVALPLSALGFLLLPMLWSEVGGLANACAQLGSLVAGIILWCMVADSARETRLPSNLLFSVSLLCTNLAQLLGTVFGYVHGDALAQGDVTVTGIALVAVYAVSMVSMFLFKDKELKGSEGAAPAAASEQADAGAGREVDLEGRCDVLARDAALTPREREILAHLGRGRTVPAIAEELVVSENTVKFHVKSIYAKLGVHSRAEVVEAIYAASL